MRECGGEWWLSCNEREQLVLSPFEALSSVRESLEE